MKQFQKYYQEDNQFYPRENQKITMEKFCKTVYAGTGGYVKYWDFLNRHGVFVHANALADEWSKYIGHIKEVGNTNSYLTLGTYRTKANARKDNLNSIVMMCVDVDYDEAYFKDWQPEAVYTYMVSRAIDMGSGTSVIPLPNYIECGHRLRLIYVLAEPYILNTTRRVRRKTIAFLEYVFQSYVDAVNKIDNHFNAEPHKLTSSVRPIGSINRKAERVLNLLYDKDKDSEAEKYRYPVLYAEEIRVYEVSKTVYTMQELADMMLPYTREEWNQIQEEKKQKKRSWKSKMQEVKISLAGKVTPLCKEKKSVSIPDMMRLKIEILQKLQQKGYDVGHREQMCFQMWNAYLTLGYSQEECYKIVKAFNENFQTPLKDSKVRNSKAARIYKYTWRQFLWALYLDEKGLYQLTGIRIPHENKNEYMRNYMKLRYHALNDERVAENRKKRAEKKLETALKIMSYLESGMRVKDIAEKLGITRRTVLTYRKWYEAEVSPT